ncbi:MAG: hypothetical protein ACYC99_11305 [Candidatus Geothermincolia bacterium]
MVLVIGRHKLDLAKPFEFCGRHKLAVMVLVMVIVLSMSASVCALQGGALSTPPVTARSADTISGGQCPTTHAGIVYSARYNYAAFRECEWFMVYQFTDIRSYMTADEANAVNAWISWYGLNHDGYVRFPQYKKLWSRSAIGQPI